MRKCPDDHVDLIATDRQGIEVDYCPKCRGVWLDRGELDKIVERSGGSARAEQARLEGQAPPVGDPRALQITQLFDF
ncbi:MAG: zf-TFIIB domain-containing protein [Rhodospirillaceae bacterium]|mgnify:CR=1 FL=1|nr:zf-TFIIB domain-containing protein [Rhodospirillaceae bacterium]